jgi:hypothetical protein
MGLTASIALSLSACIEVKKPINVDPGPDLPVAQVSVLKVAIGAQIESIDGQPPSSLLDQHQRLICW